MDEEKMSQLKWSPKYELGLDSIDSEHKELFKTYNDFHAALLGGQMGVEEITSYLTDLMTDTQVHFTHEQALMERLDYPRLAIHKNQHEHLIADLTALTLRFNKDILKATDSVLLYMYSWLIDHIQGEDRTLCDWIRQLN